VRKIRKNIFETNSSSTHAICISKEKLQGYPADNRKSKLFFRHGSFGWASNIYDDVENKAAYLYQTICDLCYFDRLRQIRGWLDECNIECVFEEMDKCGYVDHAEDSYEWLSEVLKDKETFITYLFGDSFVVTGNDNDEWFEEKITELNMETPGGLESKYDIYIKGN